MEKLNFDIPQISKKTNWKTIIIVVIILIALAGIGKYYYDKYQNAVIDTKVEKAKGEKSIIEPKITAKKQEIKDSATDFKASQNKLKQTAIEIQKTTNYEKPIIKIPDYNFMLDSLSVAQPD